MIHSLKATDLNTQYVWYGNCSNLSGRWLSISWCISHKGHGYKHTFHAFNKPPVYIQGIIDITFNIPVAHFSQLDHYEADNYRVLTTILKSWHQFVVSIKHMHWDGLKLFCHFQIYIINLTNFCYKICGLPLKSVYPYSDYNVLKTHITNFKTYTSSKIHTYIKYVYFLKFKYYIRISRISITLVLYNVLLYCMLFCTFSYTLFGILNIHATYDLSF